MNNEYIRRSFNTERNHKEVMAYFNSRAAELERQQAEKDREMQSITEQVEQIHEQIHDAIQTQRGEQRPHVKLYERLRIRQLQDRRIALMERLIKAKEELEDIVARLNLWQQQIAENSMLESEKICNTCRRKDGEQGCELMRCKCKNVFYCSPSSSKWVGRVSKSGKHSACQINDWQFHKRYCTFGGLAPAAQNSAASDEGGLGGAGFSDASFGGQNFAASDEGGLGGAGFSDASFGGR